MQLGFHPLVAEFGQRHRFLLFVEFVVFRLQRGHQGVDGLIKLGAVFQGARNNERGACFVDQDAVDFIDDAISVATLDHLVLAHLHVVAKIIKAQLVVGRVGHVASVLLLAFGIVEIVDDDADSEPQEFVDLAHPFAVAAGEVIVDGDDVDAFASERVQINGGGRDQGFAFAGLHFGNVAFVEDHPANQLDIEMTLTQRAFGGFAHRCEGGHQQIVEGRFAVSELLAEHDGAFAQLLIGQGRDFRFERVDRLNLGAIALDAALIG